MNSTHELLEGQKKYFEEGRTLPIKARIEALTKLYNCIRSHEQEVLEALKMDLGKCCEEAVMTEYGLVLSGITYMKRNIKKFARRKRVKTPMTNFPATSYIYMVPYGNTLIMSPWNYPFLLSLEPLVDSVAAGNTVILKPSAYSPNTGGIIKKIIEEIFPKEYVAVVLGGREENQNLLEMKFDYIFFTGSQSVGKEVMAKASKFLTPVTLELGGKSPCIIDKDCNIRLAARRIVFGKLLNLGQTCVAPDHIYCHKAVKSELIEALKEEIKLQYGEDVLANPQYGKIINQKHYDRIVRLIDKDKVVFGGRTAGELLKIEPTIMDNVTEEDLVMQEEIFGPIMPILTFESIDSLVQMINQKQHPLAFYLFTSDKKKAERIVSEVRFGGGCINDTIIHLASSFMPFGGVGESGMGSYHGRYGFETFTHRKSVVAKKSFPDIGMRYHPLTKSDDKLIRYFLK